MVDMDTSLKLLAGLPLEADSYEIKPKKLKDIIKFGYSKYNSLLSVMILEPKDLVGNVEEINENFGRSVTVLDIIISSQNMDMVAQLIGSLKYFLNEENFTFHEDLGIIFGEIKEGSDDILEGCKIINHNNYNELVEIIRHQNCVKSPSEEEDKYNPVNEKARKIIEKLKKGQKEVEEVKAKQKPKDEIDFFSVVSAVSTKSNSINKLNVWDLTIYQLYDEFKRLEMITGYDTSILAMMNGADIKELKHWSSKIDS